MDFDLLIEYGLGIIRHGLTTLGGALVTGGIATDTELATGVGAFVTILGLVWSWYRKWKRSKTVTVS